MLYLANKLLDQTGKNLNGPLLFFVLVVEIDISYSAIFFFCFLLEMIDYDRTAAIAILQLQALSFRPPDYIRTLGMSSPHQLLQI